MRYQKAEEPFDFVSAVKASRDAGTAQHAAEQFLATKSKEFAEAERAYRKALADKIVRLRAEGTPVTAAADVARGSEEVVELKFQRDLKEGMKEAAQQSIYRHTADRRDLLELLDWSKRVAFVDEPVGR
jgi:hypothetical protein